MKSFYQAWYRYGMPPWGRAASPDLVALVESGRIAPTRTIDIGCGTGATSIYLASRGFEVTGVDFAPAAIRRARKAAADAEVTATFIVDDFTSPTTIPAGLTFSSTTGHLTTSDPATATATYPRPRALPRNEPPSTSGASNGSRSGGRAG